MKKVSVLVGNGEGERGWFFYRESKTDIADSI